MKINWFKLDFKNKLYMVLILLIKYGSIGHFIDFIIYLKIGNKCKDCERHYKRCMCNYCEECEQGICLCDSIFIENEKEKNIKFSIEEWIIKNLSKKLIMRLLLHGEFKGYDNNTIIIINRLKDLINESQLV